MKNYTLKDGHEKQIKDTFNRKAFTLTKTEMGTQANFFQNRNKTEERTLTV